MYKNMFYKYYQIRRGILNVILVLILPVFCVISFNHFCGLIRLSYQNQRCTPTKNTNSWIFLFRLSSRLMLHVLNKKNTNEIIRLIYEEIHHHHHPLKTTKVATRNRNTQKLIKSISFCAIFELSFICSKHL